MGNHCTRNRSDYEYSVHCIPVPRYPMLGCCGIDRKPLSVEVSNEIYETIFPNKDKLV